MYPGRTEEQKIELCKTITEAVVRIAKCEEKSVSISIEEVTPKDWTTKVYLPEISGKKSLLYKEPGYQPE